MSSGIVSRLKKKKINEVVATGKRMDGRGLNDYREIRVISRPLEKAEGSAEVYIGNSRVLAGVKVGLGTPFEDTPKKGVLMVNAEFTALAHPTFEPGPPRENAIELARVVDRGLRSAELLELEKLCLVEGKTVYMIFIDLFVLNYDGNLIDCAGLAAIAALKATKLPVYTVKNGVVKKTAKTKSVKLLREPIPITVAKIGKHMLVDPSADEEDVLDGRITITLDEKNTVCTAQKAGSVGFSFEELQKAINIAKDKAGENRAKL